VDRSSQTTLESSNDQDLALASGVQGSRDLERENGEPRLLVVLRLLWYQRVALAKAALVGMVITAFVTFLIPNTYEAGIQLMPPDSSSLSGGMAMLGLLMGQSDMGSTGSAAGASSAGSGIAGTVGELLGGQRPGALFVGILGSRTLADRLIDRFDLRKVYWRRTYVATRKKLNSNTIVLEDRKSGLIRIVVSDHDRVRAAAMATAYVEELNRLLGQVNTSSASREREFLEQRLNTVHQELQVSEKGLSQFSSKNMTLNPEDQGKAMLEAAAVLQGQLIAAQSELSGLEEIYTGENVRVRSLKAHVAELQQQINKVGGKDYAGATTLDPSALYPSLRQLPVLDLQYVELYRRVKVDETVFELLTKAYELAKVQEAKDTPSAKILDAARLPEKAAWPPRLWLTLGGTLLSFFLACCWIVGVERWSEVDPHQPYKAFLCREILPATRSGWQRIASRIRGWSTNNRRDA